MNGYNYVINRSVNGNSTAVLRTEGTENARKTGAGDVYVYGKIMIVKVPLAALGLSADDYSFEFKVTDNVDFDNDYLNLYDTGDAAPCGRLNFSYGY